MANFIVSYDLNGSIPTHKQMDDHLEKLGVGRGRILETVWWVGYTGTTRQLYDYVNGLLSQNDRLIVVQATGGVWRNLLVDDQALLKVWNANS